LHRRRQVDKERVDGEERDGGDGARVGKEPTRQAGEQQQTADLEDGREATHDRLVVADDPVEHPGDPRNQRKLHLDEPRAVAPPVDARPEDVRILTPEVARHLRVVGLAPRVQRPMVERAVDVRHAQGNAPQHECDGEQRPGTVRGPGEDRLSHGHRRPRLVQATGLTP